jgi:3-dehydrotetronate 4-kinase
VIDGFGAQFVVPGFPAYRLDPAATPDPGVLRAKAVDWLGRHLEGGTVQVYASAPPSERDRAIPGAARAIELTMAELTRAAVDRGCAPDRGRRR